MLNIVTPDHISEDQAPLYLIDGSGFIFRAFHALPPMMSPDKTPVNAVYGFSTMLMRLLRQTHARNIAVIFDSKRENFRNEIYADYKANRIDTPEDLIPQFSLIKQVTKLFGFEPIEKEGFEADDLIATYAHLAQEQGIKVVVVSSDKDLMQLVTDQVEMYDPLKSKEIKAEQVFEKFGVMPERVIDVQALAGDASDNVPGVPGIGVKTAALLLGEYGDLETLLERAGEIKQNKRRENLIEFAELARISKKLVTLEKCVPIDFTLDQVMQPIAPSKELRGFFEQCGFKSLISKLNQGALDNLQSASVSVKEKQSYDIITSDIELKKWLTQLNKEHFIAFDTETTSLSPQDTTLVGISFGIKGKKACYIPLNHQTESDTVVDLFDEPGKVKKPVLNQLDQTYVLDQLKPILTNSAILKIAHNAKFDLQVIKQFDIDVAPYTDTMLMSYVLDSRSHGHSMDELAELYFDYKTKHFEELVGKGKKQKTFDQVDIEEAGFYAAEDADITFRLYEVLKDRILKEKRSGLYEMIERPFAKVIADIEFEGVLVDPIQLSNLSKMLKKKIGELEEEIFKFVEHPFNIGSPKQLGEILFDELKLPTPKKGKSGTYSTHVDILEPLAADGHEVVTKILEWRHLSKLKSTYTDALQTQICQKTGRVHTNFSLAATTTGRLASTNPNLQNIPVRTEVGKSIREAFIARQGFELMSIDYSQIELRIVSAIADIKALKQAFEEGQDIHRLTASKVFNVAYDAVSAEQRYQAKAVNFGIIYGIGSYSLSQQIGCTKKEADHFIQSYFEAFPELETYMASMKEYARTHGYVKTLYDRTCPISGIGEKHFGRRAFAERQAINAPIQGTSADIIKLAMIRIDRYLKDHACQSKMILQVHDELLFELHASEKETLPAQIKAMMEDEKNLSVPLIAEIGIGKNWSEAH